jgi:hypothetical protein
MTGASEPRTYHRRVLARHRRLHRQIVVDRETLILTTMPVVGARSAGAAFSRPLFVDD